jgi:hypothetical protein
MVTNAYKRRGAKVYKTNSKTISLNHNMPSRGWSAASQLPFENNVEDWN